MLRGMKDGRRITLYDTTLRDGAQTQGVDFSAQDKALIAAVLDDLGLAYIEGGWPGANPTDDRFFAEPPPLRTSTLTAFGMTHKAGRSAANDPALNAVLNSGARGEALFDAEHFFDGYKSNPAYALACLKAAESAGGAVDYPVRYQWRHPPA
jgi:2-isopropylmalate synthase